MKIEENTRIKIEIMISMIVILGSLTFFSAVFKLEDKINAWSVSLGMDISILFMTIISILWAREFFFKVQKK